MNLILSRVVYAALLPVIPGAVFPQIAPEGTATPYAVYERVASAPESTLGDGVCIENDQYQVDVYSNSYEEAHALALACRGAMLAIPQPISVVLRNEQDAYEPDLKLYRVLQQFSFWQPRSISP